MPGKRTALRRFGAIYFESDSVGLGTRYRRLINAHARYLTRHPKLLVAVVGHRDAAESTTYPARLGRSRARVVRDALAERGVSRTRMTIASFGSRMPHPTWGVPGSGAANRRVDVIYFGSTEAGGGSPLAAKRPPSARGAGRRRRVRAK